MSSYTFSQKVFTPVPPEKGSFPLDHEGLCRTLMIKYMRCLLENQNETSKCRDVTKSYLECRMQHGLMAREEWSKLGFTDQVRKET
ncbi:cytochrome c oxidase assembly protein COX19 [Belonocnema kinseyi]|uniref:cytochrome c oxidase assembly protein COX19 n=1 Tax=Belonocnema kinseyi TaxID=2817044 RepID=UPI00143D202D|nr:cytochrome c oxidase assembly protein COX19 [Belonocnema kinseyi]